VVADDDMAALEARVSPEKILRMTVKGDEEGVRAVLKGIEGITDIAADGSSGIEGAVSLKVTTTAGADLRDTIFFAMAEQRYAVISMELVEQSLESIFLTLTGENITDKEEDD
jgi:ABC-2 type transport system ATP-binding protein